MQSTTSAQSFLPFADDYNPPRSRTTAASIWAPQPQQFDSTWPNAIDTFSRDAEKAAFRPQRGFRGFNPMFGSEDVFGPVGLVGPPRKRDIGAIGDGRKRQSPELDDDARSISRYFRRIYSPCLSYSTSSSSCARSISTPPRRSLSSLLAP
jgi:pumilio RNA-binding family